MVALSADSVLESSIPLRGSFLLAPAKGKDSSSPMVILPAGRRMDQRMDNRFKEVRYADNYLSVCIVYADKN